MALPPRDQYIRFEGLEYTDADIVDFEERLRKIYGRGYIGYRCSRQIVFTSQALRQLFEVRGPLIHELILEFFNTFMFGEAVLDIDTVGAL
ncbi:hypothetical protein Tco_0192333 [Tanacetum coccineum]